MPIHFYKIPDFYMGGFFGGFGSGKSLSMVEAGVDCANFYRKSIVSNIRLDGHYLKQYAKKFGYTWFAKYGRVFYVSDTEDLLKQQNKIILFDEVGIHLFSRGFRDSSRKDILDSIFTIRQYQNYLIFTAQGKEQIDKQFRERCQVFAYCRGFAKYDSNLGHSRLFTRRMFYLDPFAFEKFEELGKNKLIYPLWASNFRFHFSICGERERMLFRAYKSFKPVFRTVPMEFFDGNRPIDYWLFDGSISSSSERERLPRPSTAFNRSQSFRSNNGRYHSR
ncbi:zonular occludens toxin domain-containing protein [Pannus brasiliensis CCIBt3594]|uniref:Zonular occludens toxin domain-containing protein n=1 Tax=Pannus brasiliensis CCIBt3594 TaxID=1427578 RepID=A0AAW9QPK4_9CHRO